VLLPLEDSFSKMFLIINLEYLLELCPGALIDFRPVASGELFIRIIK
jgi:hypothetical protein